MTNPEGTSIEQSVERENHEDKSIPEDSKVTRHVNGDLHITSPDEAYSEITIKPNGSVYWGTTLEKDSEAINTALEFTKSHSYEDITPGRHEQKESYVD